MVERFALDFVGRFVQWVPHSTHDETFEVFLLIPISFWRVEHLQEPTCRYMRDHACAHTHTHTHTHAHALLRTGMHGYATGAADTPRTDEHEAVPR